MLIETAAKLIKNDTKVIETSNTAYPTCEEIASEDACIDFLPETLRVLLEQLIVGKPYNYSRYSLSLITFSFLGSAAKIKIASVGQAIVQAVHPHVLLAPLQIGLAVPLHHHYASRFLVDSLHHLGFCCSYQQVQEFERSAAFSHGTDIPNFSDQSVQYVADNMDHNIQTLDGNDTFHGMGMITTVTPGVRSNNRIPRIKVLISGIWQQLDEFQYSWALIFAVASYSYMPFLGVTQHHNFMGSEKETLSRNLETAITSVTFP